MSTHTDDEFLMVDTSASGEVKNPTYKTIKTLYDAEVGDVLVNVATDAELYVIGRAGEVIFYRMFAMYAVKHDSATNLFHLGYTFKDQQPVPKEMTKEQVEKELGYPVKIVEG